MLTNLSIKCHEKANLVSFKTILLSDNNLSKTCFRSFGSGTILPPARFSDRQAHANLQPEIRTLGRPGKKVHRQIHV